MVFSFFIFLSSHFVCLLFKVITQELQIHKNTINSSDFIEVILIFYDMSFVLVSDN